MHVDPQGWMVTLPLLTALLWLYFQPTEHVVKRAWRELMRQEAQGLTQVAGVDLDPDAPGRQRVERGLFWLAVAGLSVGSIASVAAHLGLMPTL